MSKHTDPSTIVPCPLPTHNRFYDLTGRVFVRLTVKRFVGKRIQPNGIANYFWECVCECGEVVIVNGACLRLNETRSCGCLLAEFNTVWMKELSTTHGMTGTPEHRSWLAMIARCCDPHAKTFNNYGGRGITVYKGWTGDTGFIAFLAYIGPRPSEEYSIDRYPNNDGNYEPGNVRWATSKDQNRNKRNNRLLTCDGITMCVSAWAERLKCSALTLMGRLNLGWPDERVIKEPIRAKSNGRSNKTIAASASPCAEPPSAYTVQSDFLDAIPS